MHVTVKLSPAMEFPSLTIVTAGSGSAEEKYHRTLSYNTILKFSLLCIPSILIATC